jgi:N,N'-diacetylchitobiose non-reducing end deacetylase
VKPQICNLFPTPDLLKAGHILCVQPHPDDMEIGAGATLARLISLGKTVTCLTVTDGSVGTYDPSVNTDQLSKTRRAETEQSANLLGVKELIWLDYPDGGNLPYEEVRSEITRAIRQLKPQAVLVCDPWLQYEVHTDHIRTGMAAAEAAFLANMPNFCPADLQEGIKPHAVDIIAFYYTAYPNTYIDCTDTWKLKMKAISCHKSQFSGEVLSRLQSFLEAKSENWIEQAALSGSKKVEAFKVLSPAHLHIFEEAWRC